MPQNNLGAAMAKPAPTARPAGARRAPQNNLSAAMAKPATASILQVRSARRPAISVRISASPALNCSDVT